LLQGHIVLLERSQLLEYVKHKQPSVSILIFIYSIMDELLTFLSIVLVPAIASIFLYLYKSKCQSVNLCYGLVAVNRDVRGEEGLDLQNRTNTTNNIELSASV